MAANYSLGEAVLATRVDMTGLQQGYAQAQAGVSAGMAQAAEGGVSSFSSIMSVGLGGVVTNVVMGAVNSIKGALGSVWSGVQGNADFETYRAQFTVLLKDTALAEERLAALAKFGADTPFELPGVVEADRILQGFGLHSQESAQKFGYSGEQIRTIAGDVAAGTGSAFNEMTLLIGKFSTGATGEAISRMAELGITSREELGKLGLEFAKSGELTSPLPESLNVVLGLMEEKYGGMMATTSKTFSGMASNFADWKDSALRTFAAPIFDGVRDGLQAFLKQTVESGPQINEALTRVGSAIGSVLGPAIEWLASNVIPAFLSAVNFIAPALEGAAAGFGYLFDFIGTLSEVFGPLVSEAATWGYNIIQQLGQGMIDAAQVVIDVLMDIGAMIVNLLVPGSPPKLLPGLTDYGQGAINAYMAGWGKGDFSIFNNISSSIQGAIEGMAKAVGDKGAKTNIATIMLGEQNLIAQAINQVHQLGDVTQETFDAIVAGAGPAGPKVAGIVRAYLDLEKATLAVEQAQDELNAVTEEYSAKLAPLNAEMAKIKDRQQQIKDTERLAELQGVLADSTATATEKEQAQLEMQEIGLRQQIQAVERERDVAVDAAKQKLDAAKAQQAAAQQQVDGQKALLDANNKQNALIAEQTKAMEAAAKAMSGHGGAAKAAGAAQGELSSSLTKVGGAISSATEKAEQISTAMTTLIGPAARTASAGFSTLSLTVTAVMTTINRLVDTHGAAIVGGFTTIFSSARAAVATALSGVTAVVSSVLGLIVGSWAQYGGQILSTAVSIWGQVSTAIGNALRIVGALVGTLLSAIVGFVQAHGAQIQTTFNLAWNTVALVVRAALAIINSIILPGLAAIVAFIQAHGQQIQAILGGVWQTVNSLIVGALGAIQGVMRAILAAIAGDWQGAWAGIQYACVSLLAGIVNAIASFLNMIAGLFGTSLGQIATLWSSNWNAIVSYVTTALGPLVSFIGGILGGISSLVQGWFGALYGLFQAGMAAIQGNWNGVWAGLLYAATALIQGVLGAAGSFLNGILGMFGSSLGQLSSLWSSVWSTLLGTVSGALAGVVNLISGQLSQVVSFFSGLPSQITGALSGLASSLNSIGQQTIQGFWDGLKSVWDQVINWINAKMDSLPQAVRSVLGMSSPSRVFREIGQQILEGLIQGLQDLSESVDEELLKVFAEAVSSMMRAVGEAFDLMKSLQDFTMPSLQAFYSLIDSIAQIVTYFVTKAREIKMRESLLDTINTIGDAMDALFQIMEGALSVSTGLVNITSVSTDQLTIFADNMEQVFTTFTSLAQEWKDQTANLSAASNLVAFAAEILDAVQTAGSAFDVIAETSGISRAQTDLFAASLKAIIQSIAVISGQMSEAGVESATKLAESAQVILQMIQSGAEAITAIGETATVPQQAVTVFATAIRALIDSFVSMAEDISTDALAAAASFAETVNKITDVVGAAVENLATLKTFVPPTAAAIEVFVNALHELTFRFSQAGFGFGETSRAAATSFAEAVGVIVSVIGAAVENLGSLKDFAAPTGEAMADFVNTLSSYVGVMTTIAGWFEDDALTAAQQFATTAGAVVAIIQETTTNLSLLDGFVAPTGEAMVNFINALSNYVGVFLTIVDWFEDEAIAAAKKFAESATLMLELIRVAVENFALLKDYGATSELTMRLFTSDIRKLIQLFGAAGALVADEVMVAAISIATTAKEVVELIGLAVDNLARLSDYSGISIATATQFINDIAEVVKLFAGAADDFTSEMYVAAVAFAEAAESVVSIIEGGVEGFAALIEYSGVSLTALQQFVDDISQLVDLIIAAAEDIATAALDRAVAFATAAKSIVDTLQGGVDGFAALDGYSSVSVTKMRAFVDDLHQFVDLIAEASESFSTDALAQAKTFADSASAIVGILQSGAEGLAAIADFKSVPVTKMRAFVDDLRQFVDMVADAASSFTVEALKQAEVFGKAAKDVVSMLKDGAEGLSSINDFKPVPLVKMKAFVANIKEFTSLIVAAAGSFTVEALNHAKAFGTAAKDIVSILKEGAEGLSAIEDFKPVPLVKMKAFVANIKAFVDLITAASQSFTAEGLSHAKAFGEATSEIVTILQEGAEGLDAINGFKPIPLPKMQAFVANIKAFVGQVTAVAGTFSPEVLNQALAFGEAVRDILEILNGAVEGLDAINSFKPVPVTKLQALIANIKQVIASILSGAAFLTADVQLTVKAFAAAVIALVATIQGAINVFGSLSAAGSPTTVVTALIAALKAIVGQVTAIVLPASRTLGVTMIAGIIAGIESMQTSLNTALAKAVLGAVDAAKAALEIASPSALVAREIANPIGEGLVLGVEAKTVAIAESMKLMATRAVMTASRSVSNTWNIEASYRNQPELSLRQDLDLLRTLRSRG